MDLPPPEQHMSGDGVARDERRKLLARLESAPLLEAEMAGFSHTLDKALMLNFVEMNLPKKSVSITARGLAANALKATNI
jgi:hypothetical protein